MKMVGHKAPRQHIGIGCNVLTYLFEEEKVVLSRKEYPLAIVALVIDMV